MTSKLKSVSLLWVRNPPVHWMKPQGILWNFSSDRNSWMLFVHCQHGVTSQCFAESSTDVRFLKCQPTMKQISPLNIKGCVQWVRFDMKQLSGCYFITNTGTAHGHVTLDILEAILWNGTFSYITAASESILSIGERGILRKYSIRLSKSTRQYCKSTTVKTLHSTTCITPPTNNLPQNKCLICSIESPPHNPLKHHRKLTDGQTDYSSAGSRDTAAVWPV